MKKLVLLIGIFAFLLGVSLQVTAQSDAGCTVVISQPTAALGATVTVTQPTCYGTNDGIIDISPSGGWGTYEYSIDGGSSWSATTHNTGLAPDDYGVQIRDAAYPTCTLDKGNYNIAYPAAVTISANGTNPSTCGGNGSIAFTFTNVPDGSYTINYATGSFTSVTVTSNAASVNAPAGTYTDLRITVSGCTSAEDPDVALTDPANPIVSITGNTSICVDGTTSLSPTTGGTWVSNGPSVASVTNGGVVTGLQAGMVTFTFTDGTTGCSSTTGAVTVKGLPTAGITNNSGSTVLTCALTTINVTATGGASYSWFDGTNVVGTSAALAITAPGTYTVTVTAVNGCTDTESITITQDIAAPSGQDIAAATTVLTCTTTSITLTASATDNSGTDNLTYSWDTDPVQTTAAISVSAIGTYTVTITDPDNGCSVTDNITITQDITPPTAGITNNTGATELTCALLTINVTATGGGTYSWSDGTNNLGTNAALAITAPGTYTVTVTAANGCTDTESIVITQDITPPTAGITNNTGVTKLTCALTTINVTATGGGTYSWSDGTNNLGTNAALAITAPGTFTVTVTAANGCTDTESITITQDITTPTFTYSKSEISCHGYDDGRITIDASGGTPPYQYRYKKDAGDFGSWTPFNADLTGEDADTEIIPDLDAGLYTIEVKDDNGCIQNCN